MHSVSGSDYTFILPVITAFLTTTMNSQQINLPALQLMYKTNKKYVIKKT